MTVRELSAEDRDAVVRIDALHTGSPNPGYWNDVFDRFLTASDGRPRVGLVAEDSGRTIGYLLGEVRAFEFGSEPCGWIFGVGVDPERLRGGIGGALLEEARNRFRKIGVATVRTMVRRNDVPVPLVLPLPRLRGRAFYATGGIALSETVSHEFLDDGAIWHLRLATPKANILDMDKVERLDTLFRLAAAERDLKAVLIEGEGPHFSFGASVEEHLPGRFETMIPGFHRLFESILDAEVATLAAVRGQCLGGGLELVAFCNRVFGFPRYQTGPARDHARRVRTGRFGRARRAGWARLRRGPVPSPDARSTPRKRGASVWSMPSPTIPPRQR